MSYIASYCVGVMSFCVKVMSWLSRVCIGACLYEFLLYTACLVLHICIHAHLHAHSAQALVWAFAQASWVKEVVAYLGAKDQAKTLDQANIWVAVFFQHLAVALRHSWCLPQPICSKVVRVSWGVCMSLYNENCFSFCGACLWVSALQGLSCLIALGGYVRWISGHGAVCHQLWFSKLPDCTKKICRLLASTWIF